MLLVSPYVGASQMVFNGTFVSEADADTYTFAATGISAAANDRMVITAVYQEPLTDPYCETLNVAVGPYTGSFMAYFDDAFSLEIWGALVPAGSTADIVVQANTTLQRMEIAVWSLYGMRNPWPTPVSGGPLISWPACSKYRDYPSQLTSTTYTMPMKERGCGLVVAPGAPGVNTYTGFANTFEGTYISGAYGLSDGANPVFPYSVSPATAFSSDPWGGICFGP